MLKNIKIVLLGLILNLIFFENIYCAFERINGGSRAEALGGAFTACADDYNSVFYNPAGLSRLQDKEISFFYLIPYGLKELGTKCCAFAVPFKNSGLGMVLQQMGTELYRESQFIFSAAAEFYKGFSIGINSKILNLSIQGYGEKSILGLDAGVLYVFKNGFKLGAFFNNINNPGFGKTNGKINRFSSVGISKKIASGLTLNLDLNKYNNYPVIMRFGGEIHLNEQFYLRMGVSDNPTKFSGGFGIDIRKISVNYCASNHIILGMTNQFSITLKIK